MLDIFVIVCMLVSIGTNVYMTFVSTKQASLIAEKTIENEELKKQIDAMQHFGVKGDIDDAPKEK